MPTDLSQLASIGGSSTPPPAAGNWLTAGIKTGYYEGLGQLGSAAEGLGAAVGSPGFSQAGADFAARQQANVQSVQRRDLEDAPWSSPSAIAYGIAKAIPSTLGMMAAAPVAAAALPLAPEIGGIVGAGLAGYPLMFGGSVDQAKAANAGKLTQGDAFKAAAVAVPEAALGGWMPGRLTKILGHGTGETVGKKIVDGVTTELPDSLGVRFLKGAGVIGGYQAGVGAANTALSQQAFTPDMPMGDRAHEIVQAALSGAVQGAVFGGATHALAGRKGFLTNQALKDAADRDLNRYGPGQPEGPPEMQGALESSNMQPGNIGGPSRYGPGLPEGPRLETEGPPEPVTVTRPTLPVGVDPGVGVGGTQTRLPGIDDPMIPKPPRPGEPVAADADPSQLKLLSSENDASREPLVEAMRQRIVEAVGSKGEDHPFVQNLDATNDAELVNEIKKQRDVFDDTKAGNAPAWFNALSESVGLTDKKGNARDLNAELAGQMKSYEDLTKKAKINESNAQGQIFLERAQKLLNGSDDGGPSIKRTKELIATHEQAAALDTARDPVPAHVNEANKVDWAALNNIKGLADLRPGETKVPDAAKILGEKAAALQLLVEKNDPNVKYKVLQLSAEARKYSETQRERVTKTMDKASREAPAAPEPEPAPGEPPVNREPEPAPAQAEPEPAPVPEPLDTTPVGTIPKEPVAAEPAPVAARPEATPAPAAAEPVAARPEPAPAPVRPGSAFDPNRVRMTREERLAEIEAASQRGTQQTLDMRDQARNASQLGRNLPEAEASPKVESATPKQDLIKNKPSKAKAEAAAAEAERAKNEEVVRKVREHHDQRAMDQVRDIALDRTLPDDLRERALKADRANDPVAARKVVYDHQKLNASRMEPAPRPGEEAPKIPDAVDKPDVAAGKEAPPAEQAAPDWAQVVADKKKGEVVFHDNEVALVTATGAESGKTKYLGVNKATGQNSRDDISLHNGKAFTPEQMKTLRDARDRLVKKDVDNYAAKPDGPFTDAESNVVTSKSIDPALGEYAAKVLQKIGLGKVRVFLVDGNDMGAGAAELHGLHGDYQSVLGEKFASETTENGGMRQFGPNGKDFYIHLKTSRTMEGQLETLGHEIGHVLQKVKFDNAPVGVRNAVIKAFNKWIGGLSADNPFEAMQSTRNKVTGEEATRYFNDRGMTPRLEYYTAFHEWFADQVSRWTTSQEKPTGLIEKFFHDVAQAMKQFVGVLTGRNYEPDAAVRHFIETSPPNTSSDWTRPGVKRPIEENRGARDTIEANGLLKDFAKQADAMSGSADQAIKEAVLSKWENVKHVVRKAMLYAATTNGIIQAFKDLVPSTLKYQRAQIDRDVRVSVMNQKSIRARQMYDALPPKAQDLLRKVMAYTADDIKPGASRDEHTWLDAKDKARLENKISIAAEDMRKLSQMGGKETYEALRLANVSDHMSSMASHMYNFMRMIDPKSRPEGFALDPFEHFQYASEVHDDPAKSAAYWNKIVGDGTDIIGKHIAKTEADAQKLVAADKMAEAQKLLADIIPMKEMMKDVGIGVRQTMNAPYFHLGRQGDFFVSGHFKMTDGVIDPTAFAYVQKRLNEKGFDNLSLQRDSDTSRVFARVGSAAQMQVLHDLFNEFTDKGHFDASKGVSQGTPTQINSMKGMAPQWMQRIIEHMQSNLEQHTSSMDAKDAETYRAAHDNVQRDLVRKMLDMMPDNSINKALQKRDGTSGFEANMMDSFAHRAAVSSRAVGTMSVAQQMASHIAGMSAEVQTIKNDRNATTSQVLGAQQSVNELMIREAQRQWMTQNPTIDWLRTISHVAFIGMSPAYVMTLLTQIPTLSLPALGQTHGYLKASTALAKAAPMAIKVMKAILTGADAATVGFSEKELLAGGVPKGIVDFIMKASNRGDMNNGSYTHAQYQLADGASPRAVKIKNWASVMGLAAEMFPRIITALAAKDLHEQRPVGDLHEFVGKAVKNSQFDWSASGSSRFTGKMGLAGPLSPLMFAFTGFQTRMIESYYQNVHDAIAAKNPGDAKEARSFLAGHLVATMAIAGTMGLPAAGMFAGAADRLADWLTGKDDYDVNASYRTFLTDTFGREAGEVIARGLPRAAGIDLSHVGDQNLLPFTQLMQEKRKIEDAEGDWAKTMTGSAAGLVVNAGLGLRDMANGDWLMGAQKIVPTVLKGPVQALRLSKYGYEDKDGTKQPINADALEILKTAVGFKPAAEADYNESKRTMQGLEETKKYRGQNIARHLALATQRGDFEDMQNWMEQGNEFQMDHLGGADNPAMNLQRTLMGQSVKAAYARGLGMPVGGKPSDSSMRGMTSYANYRNNE